MFQALVCIMLWDRAGGNGCLPGSWEAASPSRVPPLCGSPLGERGLVLLARGSFVLPCARPAWPGHFRVGICWPKAGSS